MGVKGWNQFLVQRGWIPRRDDDNNDELWLSDDDLGLLGQHIPVGSQLHVDGLSLCFHLHRVAYARHTAQFRSRSVVGTFQALQLLPTFLPLSLLHDVTKEWAEVMRTKCQLQVIVYMDGNQRYLIQPPMADVVEEDQQYTEETFKQETETKRRTGRQQELSLLQQFCLTGRLPVYSDLRQYEEKFPKGQLFIAQVLHTLQHTGKVPVVFCAGEADRVVAEAAAAAASTSAQPAYAVGTDSDYCFFARCHYIPLDTLHLTGNTLSACVLSRQGLAHYLSLPERQMVEVAILLGNDYIDPSEDMRCNNPENIAAFLGERGPEYQVESTDGQIGRGLEFVRKLYNLESLENFTLQTSHDPKEHANLQGSPCGVGWVRDLVLQTLEQEAQHSPNKLDSIQPMHVQVFAKLRDHHPVKSTTTWRPYWGDMAAARCIERTISRAVRKNLNAMAIRLQSPLCLFDSFRFHSMLHDMRRRERSDAVQPKPPSVPEERPVLPVDQHEQEILLSVQHNRVTIIQGETGCGKSSRIPIMLLNAPPPKGLNTANMFVSQPRRIAAKALVERLRSVEPDLRDQIALRMGHGVRGYLVRLLASNPSRFDNVSYIIVDEVHERSVDTDLLCLLCKRLLSTNPRIRLVLMSATLAAALYRDYFNVDGPTVMVGSRLHPVQYKFVEDILTEGPHSNEMQYIATKSPSHFSQPPRREYMNKLHVAVAQLATTIGVPGTSVLIFVGGMSDILALSDLIDNIYVPGCTFSCFPIHGDIPFEEQMQVFDSPAEDEVKVVIATNAAESSVTLPDVDNVICLGLCKQITYNPKSHRQMLIPAWISQASAEQRAGRTGRVRPGTVYRVYSRELFDQMSKYEVGEICRIPLDSVILLLKEILAADEEVIPSLLNCLEPPNVGTIDRSFVSLYRRHFITSPSDKSTITNLGKFVASLGVDLALGALIGLGIQFGVGAEAVQLAGVLSTTKDPWIMSNPMIHEASDYNEMIKRTYTSKVHFDANQFSEPFSAMNLLWAFQQVPPSRRSAWCRHHGIFLPRLRRLKSTCESLADRVASFLHIDRDALVVPLPPCQMHQSKTLILRTIQVWVFSDALIELRKNHGLLGGTPSLNRDENSFTVPLERKSDPILVDHLKQVLLEDRHCFSLIAPKTVKQTGGFKVISSIQDLARRSETGEFDSIIQPRLLSYATERDLDFVGYLFADRAAVFLRENEETAALSVGLRQQLPTSSLSATRRTGLQRGLNERACGLWSVQASCFDSRKQQDAVEWDKIYSTDSCGNQDVDLFTKTLLTSNLLNGMLLRFPWSTNQFRSSSELTFCLQCSQLVATPDIKDILASPQLISPKEKIQMGQQVVKFTELAHQPVQHNDLYHTPEIANAPSWNFSFFTERIVPEGARILAVLASGRRQKHFIRLCGIAESEGGEGELGDPVDEHLDIFFPKDIDFATKYWSRLEIDSTAYVPTNSIPATAIPLDGEASRLCCCSDVLEVSGGSIRANGLTLLPNRCFVAICFVSFGLNVIRDDVDDELTALEAAFKWLSISDQESRSGVVDRLITAQTFHECALDMGESLICFPAKVKELLKLFDGLDGALYEQWDSLESNPFISPARLRRNAKHDTRHQGTVQTAEPSTTDATLVSLGEELFATSLSNGRILDDNTLYSSNLLALLVLTVRREREGKACTFSLENGNRDWKIDVLPRNGESWFGVAFQNYGFRNADQISTARPSVPHWACPAYLATDRNCLPPNFRHLLSDDISCVHNGVIYHKSLELAVRIEAAIWLERQFKQDEIHWYQRSDMNTMLSTLRSLSL